jgi:hypothetical protein
MKIKNIIAATLTAAVLLSLSACETSFEKPDYRLRTDVIGYVPEIAGVPGEGITTERGEVNERGNTSGNINNFGLAAMQGDWIFYGNHTGIYRLRQDGSEEIQISNMSAFGLNVVGDWVYFLHNKSQREWHIYRMKTNGTEVQLLLGDEEVMALYLNVVGEWMYFCLGREGGGTVWKMKTDGSELQQLNTVSSHYLNIVGNWIFFSNEDSDWRVYRMRASDGSGLQRATNFDSEYVNIVGEWVFFVFDSEEDDEQMSIFRVSRDSEHSDVLIRVNRDISSELNVVGDWIFYINNDNGSIYRIDIYGDNRSRLNTHVSSSLSVVGDWIYYLAELCDIEEIIGMFRMRLNGSDIQQVL